jgi:hypothetical protein
MNDIHSFASPHTPRRLSAFPIMTRATEAATFFGITATLYLALLFQWLPITLPETIQEFTLPVVRNIHNLSLLQTPSIGRTASGPKTQRGAMYTSVT